MRTATRLLRVKEWLYKELCQGRQYKTPPADQAITNTGTAEPKVYLGWQPLWSAMQAQSSVPHYALNNDPFSVCPAITVMPGSMPLNNVPEKRFDQYRKIQRPKNMGSSLTLTILFSIYEPGIRLPGFEESLNSGKGLDKNLMLDATEEGLLTLLNWMDDAAELLLRERDLDGYRGFALAGGVSANRELRRMAAEMCGKLGIPLFMPELHLCTDNGAMIGSAAYYRLMNGELAGLDLNAMPALRLV